MKPADNLEQMEKNKKEWDSCRDFLRVEIEHILMNDPQSVIVYTCKKCHQRGWFKDERPFAVDNIVNLIIEQMKSREAWYAVQSARYYLELHGELDP